MSGWRIVVDELYQRGPLACRQFNRVAAAKLPLSEACRLGLVRGPGKGHNGEHYTLTPAGVDFAQRRMAYVTAPREPVRGRTAGRNRMVLTWLSALPAANAIRL